MCFWQRIYLVLGYLTLGLLLSSSVLDVFPLTFLLLDRVNKALLAGPVKLVDLERPKGKGVYGTSVEALRVKVAQANLRHELGADIGVTLLDAPESGDMLDLVEQTVLVVLKTHVLLHIELANTLAPPSFINVHGSSTSVFLFGDGGEGIALASLKYEKKTD